MNRTYVGYFRDMQGALVGLYVTGTDMEPSSSAIAFAEGRMLMQHFGVDHTYKLPENWSKHVSLTVVEATIEYDTAYVDTLFRSK